MQTVYVKLSDNKDDKFIQDATNKNTDGYVQKAISDGDYIKALTHPESFWIDDNGVLTKDGWPSGGYQNLTAQIQNLQNQVQQYVMSNQTSSAGVKQTVQNLEQIIMQLQSYTAKSTTTNNK